MTDAERHALAAITRAVGDLFGACETAARAHSRCGQKDAALALATTVVEVTEKIVATMPVLALHPTMLVSRARDTDASAN